MSDIYYIGHPCGASSEDSFHPRVIEFVENLKEEDVRRKLLLGEIKERYSNTVRRSYVSFGCFYCDAIFGNFYVFQEVDHWFYLGEEPEDMIVLDLPQSIIEELTIQRVKYIIEHRRHTKAIEEKERKEEERWNSLPEQEKREEKHPLRHYRCFQPLGQWLK